MRGRRRKYRGEAAISGKGLVLIMISLIVIISTLIFNLIWYLVGAVVVGIGVLVALRVRKFKRRQRLKEEREVLKNQDEQDEKIKAQSIFRFGIKDVDVMSREEFKEFLGFLFEYSGDKVELIPESNKSGADLVVTSENGKRLVIQAKRLAETKVKADSVQEVFEAMAYFHADDAAVITNQKFSEDAEELAKNTGVFLFDREELIELILEAQKDAAQIEPTQSNAIEEASTL